VGHAAGQPLPAPADHGAGQASRIGVAAMHPAFSILFFTTLAGAAQGLLVALALAQIAGVATDGNLVLRAVGLGVALLLRRC